MADSTKEQAAPPPQLTEAELAKKAKKEAERKAKQDAKLAKFKAKQEKLDQQKLTETDKDSEKKKKKKEKDSPAPAFVNTTPKGEKKDMSEPLAGSYDPRAVESAWFDWWNKEGFFKPEFTKDGKIKPEGLFVVPAPPPNVTGSLHIGHALTVALQDTLIRWNRMLGKTVLFNPGTDHAGLSCQVVVEKMMWKEDKITRHDIGRENFVQKVWEWKEKYGERIHEQFHRLGASYDWDRAVFTMDDKPSKAVRETFIRLHDEGTIYRANRLVNWCVRLNTTLSNLEVENKELAGRTMLNVAGYEDREKFEFGVLNEFAYEIEGTQERLIVSTTRIETMVGDTAIAVHPNDERYKHLHGKFALHPFLDRRIPIVTDDIAVDMEFGTGAVKITPAHDFNDYEVGKRHNLEFINILNDDGTFNDNAGPYNGMKRFHVRKQIVEDLKAKGLFVGVKENPMSIPVCGKSGDVIEPLMKPQWWVNCKGMAKKAMEAVTQGELKISPKTSEDDWFRWLGSIQDWCISRQLWWGHRVPAYFVNIEGENNDISDDQFWLAGHNETIAREKAEKKFPGKKFTLEQDPDVLDTWFSSGLWPFSIMGWPDKTDDMEKFYPSSLLETGWDILFFWVARMVMLGIKLTGKVPFKEVFCHALIRDAHGRKMSKSLGNVIDPIEVIEGISLQGLHDKLQLGNLDPKEIKTATSAQKADFPKGIPECGTDALRFALCAYTTGGVNIKLDIQVVEGHRRFCNKLWNATRFALMKLGDDFKPAALAKPIGDESLADKWILHKFNEAARKTNDAFSKRKFMDATIVIYNFWINELCDVYIETVKPICDADTTSDSAAATSKKAAQQTLYTCLEGGLKLLHPIMPFVTEELFQRLTRRPDDDSKTIVKTKYPVEEAYFTFQKEHDQFEAVFDVVKEIRSLASKLEKKKDMVVHVQVAEAEQAALLEDEKRAIQTLAKGTKELTILKPDQDEPANCEKTILQDKFTVFLQK